MAAVHIMVVEEELEEEDFSTRTLWQLEEWQLSLVRVEEVLLIFIEIQIQQQISTKEVHGDVVDKQHILLMELQWVCQQTASFVVVVLLVVLTVMINMVGVPQDLQTSKDLEVEDVMVEILVQE